METNQYKHQQGLSKSILISLLLAPMVQAVDSQVSAEASQRLHALEKVQIQVYDALEKLHESDWKGSGLNTEHLLQTSSLSDKELNTKIIKNLGDNKLQMPKKMVGLAQTSSKSKTTGKLNCVIGGKECLYEDRKSLINGDITQFAQTQFKDNQSVELPSADFNIQITDEPNAIDDILNQKLQSDINAQTTQQLVQQTVVMAAAPALVAVTPTPTVTPQQLAAANEKKLDEQARAIALANIEAQQKKAELQQQAKIQAEQAAILAKQKDELAAQAKARDLALKQAQDEATKVAAQAHKEEQKRLMAQHKASAIAKAKANLAEKLSLAAEKRKREILLEEAAVKAKELAKFEANSLAEQKASQIAQAMIEEQEKEELAKLAVVEKKNAAEAAKIKAVEDAKAAEISKKKQAEDQIREKAEAKEKKDQEAARREAETMEQAKQEMEEQTEKDKAKQMKEDAEYAQEGDLGDMMNNLKEKTIQEQKDAVELVKQKQEQAKQDALDNEKKQSEAAKSAKEMVDLTAAVEEPIPQMKLGEPTQQEIDDSIQLTQIGSEIKMNKKSSMYLEEELEKKHKKKKQAKKKDLSNETEKLLAEASDALKAKPEMLKKAEEKKSEEEKKPEAKAEQPKESLVETKDVKVTDKKADLKEVKAVAKLQKELKKMKSAVKTDHKKSSKKHHKKHKKAKKEKKESSSSSSSDEDEQHVAVSEQQTSMPPVKPKIQVVKEECPMLVQQQCPKCTLQPIIELSQQGGKDFLFSPETSDVLNPENLQFRIVPNNVRDQVNSIDVIDNQKILGFSTYNNLLTDGAKHDITDSDADYYNVTVNLVVKRMSQFEADAKHKKYGDKIALHGGVMANATTKAETQATAEVPDQEQKAKDATALMIEIDTKKKADEDLATRLAGFANSAYGQPQPQSEESTETTDDPNTLLTQIVTEIDNQTFEDSLFLEMTSDMSKKHRAVSADSYDNEENEIEDQQSSFLEYIPKNKRDQVDEEFSKIQDEDMKQEKNFDSRQQQVIQAQREHDAFMRRLDKKGMSAVTHDEDDKTTLDVISDSLEKKDMVVEHKRVHTQPKKVISDAEMEANNLSESMKTHRLFENHQLQTENSINLDSYNQEAITKIQTQLEARVQKDLEQLSVIANNKYAGGKRMYDYQLVRLSDGQQKLEKEALEKADELYYKHSNLKQQEEEMDSKFSLAKQTLDQYKSKFYKDKSRLQQDHDSYIKIKQQTEKDLKEQIAIQSKTENMAYEALDEKAKLYANSTQSIAEEKRQMVEAEAKKKALIELEAKKKAEAIKKEKEEVQHKAEVEQAIRNKVEAEIKAKQEAEEKKKAVAQEKAKKEAEEKAKKEQKARLEAIAKAKKKAEEKAAELAKAEAKAKEEAAEQEKLELKAKQESEELEKQEELLKKKAEDLLKKKKDAAESAKHKLEVSAKAIVEAKKKEEEYEFNAKVKEEVRKQSLIEEKQKKKQELVQIQAKRAEYEAKMKSEAVEKSEQLELEKAEAEAKTAEEAQKKAEKEAQDQIEDMKKTDAEEKEATEKAEKKKVAEKSAQDLEMKKDYNKILTDQKEKTRQTVHTLGQLEQESALQITSETHLTAQAKAEAKAKAEKEAIKKIADATMAGIKAGETASKKLHAEAKGQSEEATVAAVEKLQTKFENTKKQVMAIVSNFGKIRSDLSELKAEYIQEQSNLNNYVQLSETSDTDAKVTELKVRLNEKRHEVQEIVLEFQKMHNDLRSIKSDFETDKNHSEEELVQMKDQAEETALSELFEKQSHEVQHVLIEKQKDGLKSAMEKNLKSFLGK